MSSVAPVLPPSPVSPNPPGRMKSYDYVLKFLLVGDSDVGKEEILNDLDDGSSDSPYGKAEFCFSVRLQRETSVRCAKIR